MDIGFITMMVVAQLASSQDPLFASDTALIFARDLEWSNRAGSFDRLERAAFIVDTGDGELQCVAWPATQQHERATYRGGMPRGAIAIIHTHPMTVPWPSTQDEAESLRLGIPIYVLTPRSITKVTPGQAPVMVRRGTWLDPVPSDHPCSHPLRVDISLEGLAPIAKWP
jgi:hypothetical protein